MYVQVERDMAGSGFIPVRPSLFVTEDMVTVGGGRKVRRKIFLSSKPLSRAISLVT